MHNWNQTCSLGKLAWTNMSSSCYKEVAGGGINFSIAHAFYQFCHGKNCYRAGYGPFWSRMLTCNCFWPGSSGPIIHAIESIGIVAGWNSSSLALMASCSLSFTSSINPESLRVAALQSFFPNSIFFGVFSHSKGLGANGCQYRTGSVQKRGACVLYIYLPNGSCFRKGSLGGFCQLLFTFLSQSPFGVKVAWNADMSTCLTHTPLLRRKRSISVRVFLGLTWPYYITNCILLQKVNEFHQNPRLSWKMFEQCVWPLNLLPSPAVPTRLFLSWKLKNSC